jgi:hypothetical protein
MSGRREVTHVRQNRSAGWVKYHAGAEGTEGAGSTTCLRGTESTEVMRAGYWVCTASTATGVLGGTEGTQA